MKGRIVWQICFKVVRIVRGRLMSVSPSNVAIEYQPGEFSGPIIPESPLFAFETCDFAQDFIDSLSYKGEHYEIWKALAMNPRPVTQPVLGSVVSDGAIEDFWKGKPMSATSMQSVPPGTIICSELKLIRSCKTFNYPSSHIA